MTPQERQKLHTRRQNRLRMRITRAREVDPIEQLARLVNLATTHREATNRAAHNMRPLLECVAGIEFDSSDAEIVNNARRIMHTEGIAL